MKVCKYVPSQKAATEVIKRWETLGFLQNLEENEKEDLASMYEDIADFLIKKLTLLPNNDLPFVCNKFDDEKINNIVAIALPTVKRLYTLNNKSEDCNWNGIEHNLDIKHLVGFLFDNHDRALEFAKEREKNVSFPIDIQAEMCSYLTIEYQMLHATGGE